MCVSYGISAIVRPSVYQQQRVSFCITANVYVPLYIINVSVFLYRRTCVNYFVKSNCVFPTVSHQRCVSFWILLTVCVSILILATFCFLLYISISVCLLYISNCVSLCKKGNMCLLLSLTNVSVSLNISKFVSLPVYEQKCVSFWI